MWLTYLANAISMRCMMLQLLLLVDVQTMTLVLTPSYTKHNRKHTAAIPKDSLPLYCTSILYLS